MSANCFLRIFLVTVLFASGFAASNTSQAEPLSLRVWYSNNIQGEIDACG